MARSRWLDRPEFRQDTSTKSGPRVNPPRERLLEAVRAHPNEWAKVAEYKGDKHAGKKRTHQMVRRDEMALRRYVASHYPLEDWAFSTRLVKGTWADRDLRIMFRGTLTPEDAEHLREKRMAAYSSRVKKGETLAEQRANRRRALAEFEQEQNRLRRERMG